MPTLIDKALRSAFGGGVTKKASRGTLSSYTIGVNPSWGQPLPAVAAADASGLITPERMREVVMKTPTAAAAMNAILDYAGGVKWNLRNIDASKPVPKGQVKQVKRLLASPNPTQTSRQFRLSLLKDMVTLGFAAIEIERDQFGEPFHLWVLDAARLKVDYDEHGTVLGYDMLNAHGIPIIKGANKNSIADFYDVPKGPGIGVTGDYIDGSGAGQHAWEPEDVIFLQLNPQSNSVYPYSRITQLFTCAVIEDMMMAFIAARFTDSNVPFGIMDLGDVSETELRTAIGNWNSQAKDQHRILLTGSKGGGKFIPFGYHLKDLEATGLLNEVRSKIMGILGVTMNELGESGDINKSNGYNLSFTFKKRAIEPILNELTETLTTRLLWQSFGYSDLEFYYDEIDSRDDLVQAQIDEAYMKLGVITINQIRNNRGDPNIPGGEKNYVFTGASWIPVDLLEKMAETMILVETTQGGNMSGPNGADNVRVKVGQNQSPTPSTPRGSAHTARTQSGNK